MQCQYSSALHLAGTHSTWYIILYRRAPNGKPALRVHNGIPVLYCRLDNGIPVICCKVLYIVRDAASLANLALEAPPSRLCLCCSFGGQLGCRGWSCARAWTPTSEDSSDCSTAIWAGIHTTVLECSASYWMAYHDSLHCCIVYCTISRLYVLCTAGLGVNIWNTAHYAVCKAGTGLYCMLCAAVVWFALQCRVNTAYSPGT